MNTYFIPTAAILTALVAVGVAQGQEHCLTLHSCPRDLEVALLTGTNRIVTFRPTATNQCTGSPVAVQCLPPSGSAFPLGTTKVDCVAKDKTGEQRCSFDVVVVDTTPPSLLVPKTLTVECQGWGASRQEGATVYFSASATDNTGKPPSVTLTPPSGSWFSTGTNVVTAVATDGSANSTTNTFQVVVVTGPKCQVVSDPQITPDNWSFELGRVGWQAVGPAFEFQPVAGDGMKVRRIDHLREQMEEFIGGGYWQDLRYRIGAKGNRWIGTADNYSIPQGGLFDNETHNDALVGELRSKLFKIEKPYITFLIGGTHDTANLRVELLIATNASSPDAIQVGTRYYEREYSSTGHGRELMRRETWAMDNFFHHHIGREAIVRIVDDSSTGHLNVDDFRFVDVAPIVERVVLGRTNYPSSVVVMDGFHYDWDSPVWGFVDLHTHPMSHLGFAEGVMFGNPDGPVETALGDCNCLHGGYDILHNRCGNYLRQALEMGTDDDGNDPHREGWNTDRIKGNTYGRFRHWPIFSTSTHQQMWHEWIKRAYDGGLRVMVALCVNNALMGSASQGPGPLYDKEVGDNQMEAMKAFAEAHSDFMEIALDPYQLRDIVRRNKLAIILGSELDDIGDIARNNTVDVKADPPRPEDMELVRNEVERLYNNGLRYIFPVHLVNNKFGGTQIGNVMLDMANTFLNHEPLQVEPASPADHIRYWFPTNFDVSQIIEEHGEELAAGAVALPAVLPLLPTLTDLFGFTPPGSGAAIGAGLLPVALLGAVSALPDALQAIPPYVWPIDHHYPARPGQGPGQAPWGHRNALGLTALGRFAIKEMMKRGMMIDVDHMSQKTLDAVFQIAEDNPVGYPLNSGHNSFREQATHPNENSRSPEQMVRLAPLGGLFGLGYENTHVASLAEVGITEPNFSTSKVDNDCGGTSKTVSQIYLYALEAMQGRNVAWGTDINGLVPGPGPRFGPNSDFGSESPWGKAYRIRSQENGVRYTPLHGRPIVGPAFWGKGRDPHKTFGYGSEEHLDDNQNMVPGYAYSHQQVDFFPAISIFRYLRDKGNASGWTPQDHYTELETVLEALDDHYYKVSVRDFVHGLFSGAKDWPLTNDDIEQWLAKLVYKQMVNGAPIPDEVDDVGELEMLFGLRGVWADYHSSIGNNPPMKRSKTSATENGASDYKDWDINFEGVAHYGLLPDLIQDMSNVGMNANDLSPLFQSSEDFAQMWMRCLAAAAWEQPHFLPIKYVPSATGDGHVELTVYTGHELFEIEETDNIADPRSWRPGSFVEVRTLDGGIRVATALLNNTAKFYRLRRIPVPQVGP